MQNISEEGRAFRNKYMREYMRTYREKNLEKRREQDRINYAKDPSLQLKRQNNYWNRKAEEAKKSEG